MKYTTVTTSEILSLADRLANRGSSVLLRDQPEMQGDMMLAARVIRAMTRHFNPAEPIELNGGDR